ncbi:hypothetical protein NE237_007385 [Protea cynaroides]|uniref:FAD-binding domain-containing protein n=1 Tax=Protea cynaroides TaxID=273540 RepID=A0A9Q0KQ59_9MAGN|nr:hypothetical protein NE237_007385 [Protea cynaroides]
MEISEEVVIAGGGIIGVSNCGGLKEGWDWIFGTGEIAKATNHWCSSWTYAQCMACSPSSGCCLQTHLHIFPYPKVLIGCDGVRSVVARWLGLIAPVNSGRSAVRGLVVFPQGHGYKQTPYQFIDEGKRAGFAPLNDEELHWFLVYNAEDKETVGDPKLLQKDVMENLAKDFPPSYLEVVQHLDLATMTWAQLKFRYPWGLIFGHVCKANIIVAVDAMHPMTPDLGQGGCSALEDVVVLGRDLAKSSLPNPNGHGRIVVLDAAKAIEGIFSIQYDCGKLPIVSSVSESNAQTKID